MFLECVSTANQSRNQTEDTSTVLFLFRMRGGAGVREREVGQTRELPVDSLRLELYTLSD